MRDALSVQDLNVAQLTQFMVSMGPTVAAWLSGKLDSLRPFERKGIIYIRSRCDMAIMNLLGIESLPILMRDTRLTQLIMWESHIENHRSSPTDVLARSRQRAWIVRGRFLAKQVCKLCPRCRILRKKLVQQLMADIPAHQLQPCPPFSYVSMDFAGPYEATPWAIAVPMSNSGDWLSCVRTREL